jgi:hypothetical protein
MIQAEADTHSATYHDPGKLAEPLAAAIVIGWSR